jgi:hypothetical protein
MARDRFDGETMILVPASAAALLLNIADAFATRGQLDHLSDAYGDAIKEVRACMVTQGEVEDELLKKHIAE